MAGKLRITNRAKAMKVSVATGGLRAHQRHSEVSTWFGAGAVTLGVSAALLSGCGLAHADTTKSGGPPPSNDHGGHSDGSAGTSTSTGTGGTDAKGATGTSSSSGPVQLGSTTTGSSPTIRPTSKSANSSGLSDSPGTSTSADVTTTPANSGSAPATHPAPPNRGHKNASPTAGIAPDPASSPHVVNVGPTQPKNTEPSTTSHGKTLVSSTTPPTVAAADPVTPEAVIAPADPATPVVSTPPANMITGLVATMGLSALATNTPGTPTDAPAAWAVLAWARRQNRPTAANTALSTTPTADPPTTGHTSTGTALVNAAAITAAGPIQTAARTSSSSSNRQNRPTVNPVQTTESPTSGVVTGNLNASFLTGGAFAYSVTQQPGNGTAVVSRTGAYTYTPTNTFALAGGTDSFTVDVSRATPNGKEIANSTTQAVVTVTVASIDTPVAGTVTTGTPDPTSGAVMGTAPFTDPGGRTLTYSLSPTTATTTGTSTGGGTVTITNPSTGAFTYTPTQAQQQTAETNKADSTDTFTVTANNGVHTSTETVTVTVDPGTPQAGTAAQITATQTVVQSSGTVTGNAVFTDPAGGTLSYSLSPTTATTTGTSTGGGTVTITNAATGAFTYTPTTNARFVAAAGGDVTDTFTVTASNGVHTATETVTVPITAADITSNGQAALTAAEQVINEQVSHLASARSTLMADLASGGVAVTAGAFESAAAMYDARTAMQQADASQAQLQQLDAFINIALNNLNLDQSKFNTILNDVTAVSADQARLRIPIETAADATAVVAAQTAADGKPVFSRLQWTSQANGSVTGTVVFVDTNPVVYQGGSITTPTPAPGQVTFSITQPGAFTYTPGVFPIDYKGPITFDVFVTDNVAHISVIQSVTINNTKDGVTYGTTTASNTPSPPTSLADLEQQIANFDASFNAALVARAMDAANPALVAKDETLMAQAQQMKDEALQQFVSSVLSGAISI